MVKTIEIRPIKIKDNIALATIIKNTLIEFDGNKPGTAFNDESLQNMFEAYNEQRAIYFVALLDHKIIGGCGIKSLAGADKNVCELQKMYISPIARGKKIGKSLLEECLRFAEHAGYKACYLESFPHMMSAIHLYKQNGFKTINQPVGNTGHTACDIWMLKELKP